MLVIFALAALFFGGSATPYDVVTGGPSFMSPPAVTAPPVAPTAFDVVTGGPSLR